MTKNKTTQTVNPPGLVKPQNAYAQLASVKGAQHWVTVSGQLGVDEQGRLVGGFEGQVRRAFVNVGIALESQGLGVEDIIYLRHYLVAGQDLAAMNAVRADFLGDVRPASTMLFVSGLADPNALYEVDTVAAR